MKASQIFFLFPGGRMLQLNFLNTRQFWTLRNVKQLNNIIRKMCTEVLDIYMTTLKKETMWSIMCVFQAGSQHVS